MWLKKLRETRKGIWLFATVAFLFGAQLASSPQQSGGYQIAQTPRPQSDSNWVLRATGQSDTGEDFARIKTAVTAWVGKQHTKTSVAIVHVESGQYVALNAEDQHTAASLYKLSVAYEVYQQIQANSSLAYRYLDSNHTVLQCLELMITESDNDCGEELGWLVGWDAVDETVQGVGLLDTRTDNYGVNGKLQGDKQTTAIDTVKLLRQVLDARGITRAHSQDFVGHLLNQQIKDRTPKALPEGTKFAHKTANLEGIFHDAGYIVSETDTYIYTVMTSGWGDGQYEVAAESFQSLFEQVLGIDSDIDAAE